MAYAPPVEIESGLAEQRAHEGHGEPGHGTQPGAGLRGGAQRHHVLGSAGRLLALRRLLHLDYQGFKIRIG